jgi:ankyrin repeat protein
MINKADDEGLTPLHLGVISGNSRVVRKLLIKGADRYIKSKEGKTASALATENEFYNINDMLQLQPWWKEFYNIRPTFKPA